MRERFREWWAAKHDAGHRYRTEDWFEQNAAELLCLFPRGGTLLDVGCGNAQLLTYLAPNYDRVIGIDCSRSMLESAKRRLDAFGIKNVRLELGDACDFPATLPEADVILSNQVVQNLDLAEISRHLQQCRRVLRPSGFVGLCGIPWVNMRELFRSGGLQEPPPPHGVRQVVATLRRGVRFGLERWRGNVMGDGIGYWYSRSQVRELASTQDFDSHIVTSWYYEYRFHVRLSSRTEAAGVTRLPRTR